MDHSVHRSARRLLIVVTGRTHPVIRQINYSKCTLQKEDLFVSRDALFGGVQAESPKVKRLLSHSSNIAWSMPASIFFGLSFIFSSMSVGCPVDLTEKNRGLGAHSDLWKDNAPGLKVLGGYPLYHLLGRNLLSYGYRPCIRPESIRSLIGYVG